MNYSKMVIIVCTLLVGVLVGIGVSCQAASTAASTAAATPAVVFRGLVPYTSADKPELAEGSVEFEVYATYDELREQRRAKTLKRGKDWYPSGLYIPAGESVGVRVASTSDSLPTLIIGTGSRQETIEVDLQKGNNEITNTSNKARLIHIRYVVDIPYGITATVTIEGAKQAPYFLLGRSTDAEFNRQLSSLTEATEAVLAGNNIMLIISKESALAVLSPAWEESIVYLDRAIEYAESFAGLDSSEPLHIPPYTRTMVVELLDAGTAMWSLPDYISVEKGVIEYWLEGKNAIDHLQVLRHLGYRHQIRPLININNRCSDLYIYGLAIERKFNRSSIILGDLEWAGIKEYLTQEDTVKDFGAMSLSVKINDKSCILGLGMYQQLWLEYGDRLFHELHKRLRLNGTSDSVMLPYFIQAISEIAGENLNDFFRAWGFKVDSSVYDAVDELTDATGNALPLADVETIVGREG